MAMTFLPFHEESGPLESLRDTPPSSEISICKEQPSTPPLSEIFICKEEPGNEPNYAVEKEADRDDAGYIPTWKYRLHQLLPLSSIFAIGAYWLYFAFRVWFTVAAQRLGHTVYPMAWLFISIEFGAGCETPDIPRIHFHGCLLMRISYSTSSAYSIVANFVNQASPPP